MKTPLQELIDKLYEAQNFINDNDSREDKYYRRGLREAIEEAKKLLPKEKEYYETYAKEVAIASLEKASENLRQAAGTFNSDFNSQKMSITNE